MLLGPEGNKQTSSVQKPVFQIIEEVGSSHPKTWLECRIGTGVFLFVITKQPLGSKNPWLRRARVQCKGFCGWMCIVDWKPFETVWWSQHVKLLVINYSEQSCLGNLRKQVLNNESGQLNFGSNLDVAVPIFFVAQKKWKTHGVQKLSNIFCSSELTGEGFDIAIAPKTGNGHAAIRYPASICVVFATICSTTKFVVRDGFHSFVHPQHFRICHGFPLSPFAFLIVMTLLIQDAQDDFPQWRPGTWEEEPKRYTTFWSDGSGLYLNNPIARIPNFDKFYQVCWVGHGLRFAWRQIRHVAIHIGGVGKPY